MIYELAMGFFYLFIIKIDAQSLCIYIFLNLSNDFQFCKTITLFKNITKEAVLSLK